MNQFFQTIKKLFFIGIAIGCNCSSNSIVAQTSSISGIVNTYHKVIEIIPAKACIRVANSSGLNINTKVLLVQMKGAIINTTNTASFGDTSSTAAAGLYEAGTICSIIGDSVFLFHTLLHTYSPGTDKVQLVQFAEYDAANVIDTIKAEPWNNATGTGGVIALYADQKITLNAPVYADAAGYNGGANAVSNGTCTNFFPASGYVYNASALAPQNGAYKGEGIAEINSALSGGRGAPANGGGGGNNHNNSGGGGANLTAGGIGGGNSSTTGCTVSLRGLGGKAVSSWSGSKIFMGGGGGAGHGNSGLSDISGGHGGGIVFIWTNELIGNGFSISANGAVGGNSVSDGAGGGGGGGTIIMHVGMYTGVATVSATGGRGGNSNDGGNAGRCYGGGGGGSGGVIYFTGGLPAITTAITGGAAGIESGRDAACAVAQAASSGDDGLVVTNYSFNRSGNPSGYCSLLLASGLQFFTVANYTTKIALNWSHLNPETISHFTIERKTGGTTWQSLQTVAAQQYKYEYSAIDGFPIAGYNFYRIKIVDKNNTVHYSAIKKIIWQSADTAFSFYPNPARKQVTITTTLALPVQLFIKDINGRIVYQRQLAASTTVHQLPDLSKGIYLLVIGNLVKKITIY